MLGLLNPRAVPFVGGNGSITTALLPPLMLVQLHACMIAGLGLSPVGSICSMLLHRSVNLFPGTLASVGQHMIYGKVRADQDAGYLDCSGAYVYLNPRPENSDHWYNATLTKK